jgi:putative phosphoribosyl transferase
MIFNDRIDAAKRLASALKKYRGSQPLVLAIPRGAVAMGRTLANELEGELDVVLVRKLRAPFQSELAVGAIDESGWAYVADFAVEAGADARYLEAEKRRQMETLRERRRAYTPDRPPSDPAGRTVIVVDDGLATGATMIAALHAVRAKAPAKLICAVPVAAPDSLLKIRPYADEIVCLDAPPEFHAVSQFYREFPQVDDDEVVELLAANGQSAAKTSK